MPLIKSTKTSLTSLPVLLLNVTSSAVVKRLTGNQNELAVTITEVLSNGTKNVTTEVFKINNNANVNVTVVVGAYNVFVKTQGNTQVRELYVVR
jgi:hypothetical protein